MIDKIDGPALKTWKTDPPVSPRSGRTVATRLSQIGYTAGGRLRRHEPRPHRRDRETLRSLPAGSRETASSGCLGCRSHTDPRRLVPHGREEIGRQHWLGDFYRSVKSEDLEYDEQLEATTNRFIREARKILVGDRNNVTDDSPAAERERFMEFIGLTVWILRKFEGTEDTSNKLMMYYAALLDLSEGTVHPILKSAPLQNAAPTNTDVWRTRAALAVALDFLVRAKVPLNEAARRVGKKQRALENFLSPERMPPNR